MEPSKNEQLIIDGNSFYEIDLQCMQKKQKQKLHIKKEQTVKKQPQKRQRD